MGKAENNFENKWLEEREDGFFYTMKRLSLKDTQEINAGATYSAKCNYCGKISVSYTHLTLPTILLV